MDWFLYDRALRHERVKAQEVRSIQFSKLERKKPLVSKKKLIVAHGFHVPTLFTTEFCDLGLEF